MTCRVHGCVITFALACFFMVHFPAARASAEPGEPCKMRWTPGFGGTGMGGGGVETAIMFDDRRGNGPELIACGWFDTADNQLVRRIARWNGQRWRPLGAGLNGGGRAMAVFNDGNGDALYVAGQFTTAGGIPASRIARWDGESWSAVGGGANGPIHAMVTIDDGNGEALYIGGVFSAVDGVSAYSLARWDGSTWSSLSFSGNVPTILPTVLSICGIHEEAGPALYVSGLFSSIDGVETTNIARFDLASKKWSAIGNGDEFVNSYNQRAAVWAIAFHDDGNGKTLYAGGDFVRIGSVPTPYVARLDGSKWSSFSAGFIPNPGNGVFALHSIQEGQNSLLAVCGQFTSVSDNSVRNAAYWDGVNWTAAGEGVSFARRFVTLSSQDGRSESLFVLGGIETRDGHAVQAVAQWHEDEWQPLVGTPGIGMNATISALEVFDDGNGAALYAGGFFSRAGVTPAYGLAKWDGSKWSEVVDTKLVTGNSTVYSLYSAAIGADSKPALFVGGYFTEFGGVAATRIAKLNGNTWSALGSGVGYPGVFCMTAWDADGSGPQTPVLIVGGSFTSAGGLTARRIAVWNGTHWSSLPSLEGGSFPAVRALAVFDDDGNGPALPRLYAGGDFHEASGDSAKGLACLSSLDSQWKPVGDGLTANGLVSVSAMAIFDDGTGQALYVGGYFATAGGMSASNIAKWDGRQWSPVGGGVSSSVNAMAVFDDGLGGGPELYVAGNFNLAGNVSAAKIAKWNGNRWSRLKQGMDWAPESLRAFDDDGAGPKRPALYVGGSFEWAGNSASSKIARWGAARDPGCRGDIAGGQSCTDNVVDSFDLMAVVDRWGQTGGIADVTGNGLVGVDDLMAIMNVWGPCP